MEFTKIKKEVFNTQVELTSSEYQSLITIVSLVDTLLHLNVGESPKEKKLFEDLRGNLIDFEKLCVNKG